MAASTLLDISIVTGQSGSGKSTAIRALEDAGYFCVDNIPTALCEQLVLLVAGQAPTGRLAIGLDMRERRFLGQAPALVAALRAHGHRVRVLFLAAKTEVVLRRYSQTRRLHPLDDGCGLSEAIAAELRLLTPLRELADEIVDTSAATPHSLRQSITERVAGSRDQERMRVTVLSFGFKNGLPMEADMVLDVRFLPNPYFVPSLSEFSGMAPEVAAFVLEQPGAQAFLRHAGQLLDFLLPNYQAEGKRYFTLAIGCTGGRHRSVAIAHRIAETLLARGIDAKLNHRDMASFRPVDAPAAEAPASGAQGAP